MIYSDNLDLEAEPPAELIVDRTEPQPRHLYHSDGRILISISDQPPTGFHQGQRGVHRRA